MSEKTDYLAPVKLEMRKKKFNKAAVSRTRPAKEPLPWKYCFATILLGVILAAGFFFAARQHFYSMEYSIENSRLRNRIEDLRSKNRRLKLEKEVALSPHEIRQAAMKLGLKGITVRNLQRLGEVPESLVAAAEQNETEKAVPAVAVIKEKPAVRAILPTAAVATTKPAIVKTVKTAPAKRAEDEKKTAPADDTPKTTRSRIIDESAGR